MTKRSNSPDLKVCGLANPVDLLLHGVSTVKQDTYITGRIARRCITLAESNTNRKTRGSERVKEQSFSLVFVQLELVVDGPHLYIANTVFHVAEKRISTGMKS